MRYQEVIPAVFLERPNRFIALVLVNGQTERVHVKNTCLLYTSPSPRDTR